MYVYLIFLPFWYTILCYSSVSSVKKRNFTSKGKTILSQAAWFFFRILCRMGIYFKKLVIYQNGITMNIRNMQYVIVVSNLQFRLIFSKLKKSCKNEYTCPSRYVSLSFPKNIFLSHKKMESYPSIPVIW